MWKKRHLKKVWLGCQPKTECELLLVVYLQCVHHLFLEMGGCSSATERVSTDPGRATNSSADVRM